MFCLKFSGGFNCSGIFSSNFSAFTDIHFVLYTLKFSKWYLLCSPYSKAPGCFRWVSEEQFTNASVN